MNIQTLLKQAIDLQQKGEINKASHYYQKILKNDPNNADALHLLALIEQERGDYDKALEYFEKSEPKLSKFSFWQVNYGNLYRDMNNLSKAKEAYHKATILDTKNIKAWMALISILKNSKEQLLETTLQACKYLPSNIELHCNLGRVYKSMGEWSKAEEVFIEALELSEKSKNIPLRDLILSDLAIVQFKNSKNPDDILDLLNPILSDFKNPYLKEVAIVAMQCMLKVHRWEMILELSKFIKSNECFVYDNFGILSIPRLTETEHFKMVSHTQKIELRVAKKTFPLRNIKSTIDKPLKIGFLSSDLVHPHPVYNVLVRVLELMSQENVEIFIYSSYKKKSYPHRDRVKKTVKSLFDVKELTDEKLAKLIYGHQIDILVDIDGYTGESRSRVLSYRPAPVSINWLGYPGTMGTSYHDWIIGDEIVTPRGCEKFYSEKIWRMPTTFFPTDNSRPIEKAPSKSDLGLPKNKIIFACFNAEYKINPDVFDVWCKILHLVPQSILWLRKPKEIELMTRLKQEAKKRGVEEERIIFAPRMPSMVEHWSRIQVADIALDTWPYNMHATAIDFLWGGVPIVTLKSENFAGRVCASLLNSAQLTELISSSEEEYIQKVVWLATNPTELSTLKKKILNTRYNSSLFDTERMSRSLIDTFYGMYEKRIQKEKK